MSEFEEDPSANTGRFRAFVERGEEDAITSRRLPVSPGVLVAAGVVILAIIILIAVLA
ncbi:MAG TPA: hypothetical protein VED20_03525 [Streptosporangiaceae bacterium]|nr:hypothetical protein [Streptosporangiaceae bacterium]